jgi:D-alanine-D-alanine ligase
MMFAERFIPGREFNISLLHGKCGMEVLHPAEMTWDGESAGERMMGYSAKWTEGAEDYDSTRRTFAFQDADAPLLAELKRLCGECARVFGLSGYARVDFRVDESGQPWVLEINANPCLSPESGIAAAARHVGIAYPELISRIIVNRVLR